MGFKENLKSELAYSGMLVKELAAKSGVSQYSLYNYLNKRGQLPSVDVAVKIARSLGVSVEYLTTGKDNPSLAASRHTQFKDILDNLTILPVESLNTIRTMIEAVADQERQKHGKRSSIVKQA